MAGLFLLLVVAVYSDPLFARRNFAGRDLLAYNLPMEFAVHDAYARGRLPVWMAEISGGRPLLPNPNAGALYPIRPLLALVPFPLAMRLFPVFHWALAGLGVLCLLRRIGASRSGAWIGAVTYAFSGVAVSDVFFPHILPGLALLPWIVWATAGSRASAARKLLLVSVLFALDMLSGDVFSIAMAIACGVLWIVCESEPARQPRELLLLAGAVALAAFAAAPQIVATALWIPETGRAIVGMKLQESLFYSISPFRLLELVVPYPFGPTHALEPARVYAHGIYHQKALGLFATLYAGAFAIIGALALLRKRAVGARFARVLALATLVVCVTPSLLPAALGQDRLPAPVAEPGEIRPRSRPGARRSRRPGLRPLPAGAAAHAGPAAGRLGSLRRCRRILALARPCRRDRPAGVGGTSRQGASGGAGAGHRPRGGRSSLDGDAPGAGGVACSAARGPGHLPGGRHARAHRGQPEESRRPSRRRRSSGRLLSRGFWIGRDPHGAYRTMGVFGYRPPSVLEQTHAGNDPGRLEFSRRDWDHYTPALWRRGMVFNGDFDAGDLSRLQSLRRLSGVAAGFRDSQAFFGALALRWEIRFRDQEPLPGYHRRADRRIDGLGRAREPVSGHPAPDELAGGGGGGRGLEGRAAPDRRPDRDRVGRDGTPDRSSRASPDSREESRRGCG